MAHPVRAQERHRLLSRVPDVDVASAVQGTKAFWAFSDPADREDYKPALSVGVLGVRDVRPVADATHGVHRCL